MQLLSNPTWLLALTFLLYYSFTALQKRWKSPLISPVVFTSALLIGYLLVFNISFDEYYKSGVFIDFWLKPSVVALAVPLYRQLNIVRKQLLPLVLSQAAASIVGILSVCWLAKIFGAPEEIIFSLAPKSVTTPIAVEVSSVIGGIQPLTVAAVIITGMFGSVFGVHILSFLGISRPMAQGISLGAASHGLGVMAAMSLSEKYAAFATVGLIINGILTAVFAPIVINFIFQ